MGANIVYLIVIVASLAVMVDASSFNCFECSYLTITGQDEKCTDEKFSLTQESLTNCTTYCKKEETLLLGVLQAVSRGCATTCTESNECEKNLDSGTCTYCCNTNECNASDHVTCSIVAMSITLCAALLFRT